MAVIAFSAGLCGGAPRLTEAAPARIWFSLSGENSAGPVSPVLDLYDGETRSVYIWARPQSFAGEKLTLYNVSLNIVSSALESGPQVFDLLDTFQMLPGSHRFDFVRDSDSPEATPLASTAGNAGVLAGQADSVYGLAVATLDIRNFTGVGPGVIDEGCGGAAGCEPAWLLAEFQLSGVASDGQTSVWLQIGQLGANHTGVIAIVGDTQETDILFGGGESDPTYNALADRGQTFVSDSPDLTVIARGVPSLSADYNSDGTVDAADYTVWRDACAISCGTLPADGDADGSIGDSDRLVWAERYGVEAAAVTPPGDYNADGRIDAADYTVWRDQSQSGPSLLVADGNLNRRIDPGDYSSWVAAYGESQPACAVPEPVGLVAAALVLVAVTSAPRPPRGSIVTPVVLACVFTCLGANAITINYGDFGGPDVQPRVTFLDVTESSDSSGTALLGAPTYLVTGDLPVHPLTFSPTAFTASATGAGGQDAVNVALSLTIGTAEESFLFPGGFRLVIEGVIETNSPDAVANLLVDTEARALEDFYTPLDPSQQTTADSTQVFAIDGQEAATTFRYDQSWNLSGPMAREGLSGLPTEMELNILMGLSASVLEGMPDGASITTRVNAIYVTPLDILQLGGPSANPGDVNSDSTLDAIDINALAVALVDPDAVYYLPDGRVVAGLRETFDIAGRMEGEVDFDDVAAFSNVLGEFSTSALTASFGSQTERAAIPEPAGASLILSVAVITAGRRWRHSPRSFPAAESGGR